MSETAYAIALSRLEGVSLATALQLYRRCGSAQAVFALKAPLPDMTERAGRNLMAALASSHEALARADAELEFCERKGIRAIAFNDPDYPALLRACDDAPLVLFYLGTADLNQQHIVSVVGTRRITEYGKDLCRTFCRDLARLLPDALVVSGLAYGVDVHVHRACLEHGLQTVGVLAHGLDRIYPALHRTTAKQMVHQGGLLTEYLTQTQPKPENFVRRNRIVAGIAAATVVVESAAKGGALITARLAQDYNRSVFAFPGRAADQYSQGCNALIRDNTAGLIASAEDFLSMMGWQEKQQKPVQRELFPELSEQESLICRLIAQDERKQLNQIAVESELPVATVTSLLFDLELKGLVRPLPGGRYLLNIDD
ncbi:MAG: DNA-processing protein DprA [Bacteroidaceae bacterium]|nr:DNA-processing protein DprA [Bacteroidaceae bacterium]